MSILDQFLTFIPQVFFIAIVTIFYAKFNARTKKIQKVDIIIIIMLVILSAIRVNVGSDYYSYYLRYQTIIDVFSSVGDVLAQSATPLFDVVIYILRYYTDFGYGIFWITSILIYPALIMIFRRMFEKPYIPLMYFFLFGYYLMSVNILKQFIAITIVFVLYTNLIRRNFSKRSIVSYCVLCLAAFGFHKSALVGGVVLLLSSKVVPTKRSLIRLNILGIILAAILSIVPSDVIGLISGDKGLIYILDSVGSERRLTFSVISYIIFYNIMSIVALKYKNLVNNNLYRYSLSAVICFIPFSWMAIIGWPINRLSLYGYIFMIIVFSFIYMNFKYRLNKLLLTLFVVFFFSITNLLNADNDYYQFSTYFNSVPQSIQYYQLVHDND